MALSGNFPDHSQAALEQDYINALGGKLAKSVTKATTHLITNDADFAKPSAKVKQAQSNDIHIVNVTWLEDCLDKVCPIFSSQNLLFQLRLVLVQCLTPRNVPLSLRIH